MAIAGGNGERKSNKVPGKTDGNRKTDSAASASAGQSAKIMTVHEQGAECGL
jgi:hypothetical protein